MRVCIIGAGPAGSTCAALVAERHDVILIDKTRNFDDRVCGGAVSGLQLRCWDIELPNIKTRRMKGVVLHAPSGRTSTLGGGFAECYIFDRCEFDAALARRAEKAGAELVLGERVRKVYREGSGFRVVGERGEYRADIVVDASGARAKFAKMLGLAPPMGVDDYRFTVQALFDADTADDFLHIYFGEEFAPKTYAWVFPSVEGVKVGVGVIMDGRANPNRCLERFIERVGIEGKILWRRGKDVPVTTVGGLVRRNAMAVGDAARTASPTSGGGIVPAIISGRAAARAILEGKPQRYKRYMWRLRLENWIRLKFRRSFPMDNQWFERLVSRANDLNIESTTIPTVIRNLMKMRWL
ncbi:MAG TPA: NAD(P)/FAD-dependent oxidoreductase [Methanomicrobia archaeon]|nr:NAD(P)/FAD-dependent oxidoreductase [Methanomicrobia archaeon]HEX58714.1 NAD(P)/FAD-dependent oxidoreductase [Methanomicrobia archaeon]